MQTKVFLGAAIGTGMALLTSVVPAQTGAPSYGAADGYIYLGGGVGHYRIDGEDFVEEGDELKDNRTAYQLFAGVQAGRHLALEAGYVDFGEANDGPNRLEADGLTLSSLISIPILPNFAPYGRIGHLFWDAEGEITDDHRDYSGNDWFYGVGARFDLSRRVALRIGYDRYTLEDSDVDMGSANLQLKF